MTNSKKWKNIFDKIAEKENDSEFSLEGALRVSGHYDYDIASFKADIQRLRERAGINSGAAVLEIGCGGGAVLSQFSDCELYGIDYSSQALLYANYFLSSATLKTAEAADFSFDKKFDLVVAYSVSQYFPSDEYMMRFLINARNHLKKNGKLVIAEINDGDMKAAYEEHRRLKYGQDYERLFGSKNKDLEHYSVTKGQLADICIPAGFSCDFEHCGRRGDEKEFYRFTAYLTM